MSALVGGGIRRPSSHDAKCTQMAHPDEADRVLNKPVFSWYIVWNGISFW